MPERVESAAYYVCTEALANVAKYARASIVHVSVTHTDELATVTVDDDGVGGADPTHGTGLRGLADRVETLGGTFAVRSVHGRRDPADGRDPPPRRSDLSRVDSPHEILFQVLEKQMNASPWSMGGTGVRSRLPSPSRDMVTVESVLYASL